MHRRHFGVIPNDVLRGRSGKDILMAISAGELPEPPFGETTSIHPVSVADGEVIFQGLPSLRFCNPMGTVHGGWITTLLDAAMGCAVHSTLPPGQGYATLELKSSFVKPILADSGPVLAKARVISAGRTIAFAEADIRDEAGVIYAFGSTTCALLGHARDGSNTG